MDVNYKVGELSIKLNKNNMVNEEIVRLMLEKYHNIYSIVIYDDNEWPDNRIHEILK